VLVRLADFGVAGQMTHTLGGNKRKTFTVGLRTRRIELTHRLKALVSTIGPYQVRNWFQAFAFKWVNLCRYSTGTPFWMAPEVGLCTLNQVDP
jgi:serine/threonine protein kinase